MALPIEKKVAQAFADYKKHTDGIYKSSTLAKYQRMRDALKDGDLKSAKKLGKQVHNEVIDQGEKQLRHADRIGAYEDEKGLVKTPSKRMAEDTADVDEVGGSVGPHKYANDPPDFGKSRDKKKDFAEAKKRYEKEAKASQTGSRGGTFYVNAAGNKVYLKK